MKRFVSHRSWFLLLLTIALAAGCARSKSKVDNRPLTQTEVDAMIKKSAVTDPFLRSQTDYGLEARRAGENCIQATVTNKTSHPVKVSPNLFRLILPREHRLVATDSKSIKLFPMAELAAGERASGELSFPLPEIPAEARLAFDPHDGSQPAMAPVR